MRPRFHLPRFLHLHLRIFGLQYRSSSSISHDDREAVISLAAWHEAADISSSSTGPWRPPQRGPEKASHMRVRRKEIKYNIKEFALLEREQEYLHTMKFLSDVSGLGVQAAGPQRLGEDRRHGRAWSVFQINRAAFARVSSVACARVRVC